MKQFRPEESLADSEKRVKLMWLIFKASQSSEVKSDSVILNHRQLLFENDITYLYEEVFDYKDLLRVLPPEHKWGGEDAQTALNTMTGVTIDDLKQVETLFDLHIDVFALRESTSTDKKKGSNEKTCATVVRLSDRPVDRAVNLLICFQDSNMPHYMLVKDTKEFFKKLICEHCGSIQKHITKYKIHVAKCIEGRVRHVYPGGFHKQPLGIREKLESIGITLPEQLCYYNKFIVYDFESLFKKSTKRQKKLYTLMSIYQSHMPFVMMRVTP